MNTSTTDFISSILSTAIGYLGSDAMEQFLWLVVLGGFVCFGMAWGIGANDCANAFGTSVGSKALSLKQAVCIAAVMEFTGAICLGSAVADTVRKGIADYNAFVGQEDLLLLGMFCALVAASTWLYLATKYSLPVSTTQAIVGAIAGFALVEKGKDGIVWDQVWLIIVFWLVSPILTGICCIIFYIPTRKLVRREDAYEKVMFAWPFFVFVVVFVMTIFLFLKGLNRLDIDLLSYPGIGFGLSLGCSFVVAVGAYFGFVYSGVLGRWVEKAVARDEIAEQERMDKREAREMEALFTPETPKVDAGDDADKDKLQVGDDDKVLETNLTTVASTESVDGGAFSDSGGDARTSKILLLKNKLTYGLNVDIHSDLDDLEYNMAQNSERFDPKAEKAFASLQVCTAALDLFAHGSNDVANAVAPFAAMLFLYETGKAEAETVAVPIWVLAIGAFGMTLGLGMYGYKIISVLAVRMVGMSCTRGYCIELASALVVIVGSAFGFPTSTTHCQVGASVGIGLMELNNENSKLTFKEVVNWRLLVQVFLGWIATLFLSGISSAALYSFLAYSPFAGDREYICDL